MRFMLGDDTGGAPQDAAQARHEFARAARLGHVIVGAEFEPDDAVDVVAARGEHEHRQLARCADLRQRFDAVQARHHHIEHRDRVLPR